MNLIEKLKAKNIKVLEIPKWGAYLRKEWEIHYAQHLSTEEKRAIYMYEEDGFCGYLWHFLVIKRKIV